MTSFMAALSITLPSISSASRASLDCHPTSRGSLPLKKRKLYHLVSTSEDLQTPALELGNKTLIPVPEQDSPLALLAAASGVLAHMPSSGLPPRALTVLSTAHYTQDDRRTPPPYTGLHAWSDSLVTIDSSNGLGPSPVTPVGTETQDTVQPGTTGSQRSSRIHHPPLPAPLPNGCHGRTSRNNSFCRRTPCYNGSIYCKLHYQQYVVAGRRLPLESITEPGTNSVTDTPLAHQDKRFTGCGDDVRCIAVTTRGRACAYVCVTGTKYCHLHASYDTNPPPRRGGSGNNSSGTTSKPRLLLAENRFDTTNRMKGCPTLPDLESDKRLSIPHLHPASYPSSCETTRRSPSSFSSDDSLGASNVSIMSNGPDVSSQVYLSSISSDQWLDRKVKFATGPFVNRTGVVEKWGNGWVTVRVNDRLTHNRRSVELFLVPQASAGDGEDDDRNRSVPPAVSYELKEGGSDETRPDSTSPDQYQLIYNMQPRSIHGSILELRSERDFPRL